MALNQDDELRQRQLDAVAMAMRDLEDAAAGARLHQKLLATDGYNSRALYCLRAGIAVTYAHRFCGNDGLPKVGKRWIPTDPDERSLHDQLIVLRNGLYAHTDGSFCGVVRPGTPDYAVFAKGRRVPVFGGEGLDLGAVERLAERLHAQMDAFLKQQDESVAIADD